MTHRHLVLRLRRLLAELDYAQRRALELRTGVRFTGAQPAGPRARAQIAQLEHAWSAAAHGDAPDRLNLRREGTIYRL